jgi:hypothetical protein
MRPAENVKSGIIKVSFMADTLQVRRRLQGPRLGSLERSLAVHFLRERMGGCSMQQMQLPPWRS